jgi:hypothetical protein
MDENGTASTGHARSRIVVDLNDEIVKAVGPPQAVAWFIGRLAERLVVAPIVRILAPSIAWSDPPNWQKHTRARQAIGPPPQSNRAKPANGRRAVAFPL